MTIKAVIFSLLIFPSILTAQFSVKTIDMLESNGNLMENIVMNKKINAAGPILMVTDVFRNRIITANALSSSVSVIFGENNNVLNIPVGKRALQHLKTEAMVLNQRTGQVYIVGNKSFFIVDPDKQTAVTINTDKQYESIAVDDISGNVFLCGREDKDLAFYRPGKGELEKIPWLQDEEKLRNMNQTPPPPIRKVIATNGPEQFIIALDGYTSSMYLFDAKNGRLVKTRNLALHKGGRWHLAGYNPENHCLYVVTETNRREIIEAAKIDVLGQTDEIVKLPGFTEGVGITYYPKFDQIYIPYDNFPSVHAVDFKKDGLLTEIALPTFGNDASAIDPENDILYIACWAKAEIEIINLKTLKFERNIRGLGIIPHMFSMTFNPANGMLYFPKGGTAVNGTFGAALTVLDPEKGISDKVRLGWAPIELISPNGNDILLFDNEDEYAKITPQGSFETFRLPFDFPLSAITDPDKKIYLNYGPHQSYWPVVYIWGAKDGLITVDPNNPEGLYDRRLPRQSLAMDMDRKGKLYLAQNNWGREEQFVMVVGDEVRYPDVNKRIKIADTVQRETSQRILRYDEVMNKLYLVKTGETDDEPGKLFVIDPDSAKVTGTAPTGISPADLAIGDDKIFITDFSSNEITIINKDGLSAQNMKAGHAPLKIVKLFERIYWLNHLDNTLQQYEPMRIFKIPAEGTPDFLFKWDGNLVITNHSDKKLTINLYDPKTDDFMEIYSYEYPYGETSFATHNSSFYMTGQFGDAVYNLCKGAIDKDGRLYISDFLAGKAFVIEKK